MALKLALLHPSALGFLLASALIALAMALVPGIDRYSGRIDLLLLLGGAAYVAAIGALRFGRPNALSPEIRKVMVIRNAIASRLRQARTAGNDDTEIGRALASAVSQIDEQVIPPLSALLDRQQALVGHLARYDDGSLPRPDPEVMARLEKIRDRQRNTIEACIRSTSNSDATLVALLQEGRDSQLAASVRAWADDLLEIHTALNEILQGGEEAQGPVAIPVDSAERLRPLDESGAAAGADESESREFIENSAYVAATEEALRRFNNPGALSAAELLRLLPRSVARNRDESAADAQSPTPLEQARALRNILVTAIDRLRPEEGAAIGAEAIQFRILYQEYVQNRSTTSIMSSLSISESTFHRSRRAGIQAVARELAHDEARLAREASNTEPASS